MDTNADCNMFHSLLTGHYRVEYKTGKEALSEKLYETLTGIQTGLIEDKMGWTLDVNVQDFATPAYSKPSRII